MRSEPPALLPIFRSQHQAEMLAVLMLHPNQDFTLSDLARRLGVPASTLHLETQRVVDAGLLTSRQVGRSRLLQANTDNRIVGPLTDLLAATFGALPVVEEEFADIPDADMVVIFGSWAARHAGVAGKAADDVDVLVLGHPVRGAVYDAAGRAEARLGYPVNAVVRPIERWTTIGDALIEQVRASPHVVLHDRTAAGGVS